MKKQNPVAATVQPLPGQPLPKGWQQQTNEFGGNFDRRDLSEMWRSPQWSSKFNNNVESITKDSRLTPFPTASGV